MKKYDYLRAFASLFCQKLVLPLKIYTINAHMLSYTNTRVFKFGIASFVRSYIIALKYYNDERIFTNIKSKDKANIIKQNDKTNITFHLFILNPIFKTSPATMFYFIISCVVISRPKFISV